SRGIGRWAPGSGPGERFPDVRQEGPALGPGHQRRWRPHPSPRPMGRQGQGRNHARRCKYPCTLRHLHGHGAVWQGRTACRDHPRKARKTMTWVILTGRQHNLDPVSTPHKIITNRDYLSHPALFRGQRPKVINLSNHYSYQSRGYYASLLASSRGHRVIPTVETMIDLSERKLYENALPELEQALNRCRKDLGGVFPPKVRIFFGIGPSRSWDRFARLLFDWFRAPALEVAITDGDEWASIRKIGFYPLARMGEEEKQRFLEALEIYTGREWRDSNTRTPARFRFATLVNPQEELPPSELSSLRHWARIAEKMGVEVEPITKKDLPRLANFDALFIRETTTISNHTYRFARRAQQEGMPVIDDPLSMIRCTNKVYLNELMMTNK